MAGGVQERDTGRMFVSDITPITRRTDAREVASLAYRQLFALLDSLDPQDWDAETECPGWTVADMVGHLIGAARSNASLRELTRQQVWGLRHRQEYGDNPLDACNALQVAEHADLTSAERMGVLTELAPKAVAGRLRWSSALRPVSVPLAASGSTATGMPSRINLACLNEVIYTRDVWLHTIDISRATGRGPDLAAPVNARLVADVVAEWAGRHGQPFELHLAGPAGGTFVAGDGGQRLSLETVDFVRTLSGRADGTGLLATRVLF